MHVAMDATCTLAVDDRFAIMPMIFYFNGFSSIPGESRPSFSCRGVGNFHLRLLITRIDFN